MAKIIFVAGGVISGCGKGVAAASMAHLLKLRGHSVSIIKFDPYLNTSASVIRPTDHGETFLCEDGSETDTDLGHYFRIAGIDVGKDNIATAGNLYRELIEEQEQGKYMGDTIQIRPHLVNKIKNRVLKLAKNNDIVIAEIGGSVGDAESYAFFEAARQLKQKHKDNVLISLVAPILWVNTIKEFKTKPLQNAVRDLQQQGIMPDMILCRVDRPCPDKILDKIASLTGVEQECIFQAPDVETVYQVPLALYEHHVDDLIVDKFHLKRNGCRIHKYRELVDKYVHANNLVVNIGIFGKYDNGDESYISLKEALIHAATTYNRKVNIHWINSEALEKIDEVNEFFNNENYKLDGIVVPGGFDNRGVEGKIKAIKYARENKIPFLGICLGLQCCVIEFARNACKLEEANSVEFNKNTPYPVIHFVKGQESLTKKAETLRLGAYDCELSKNSLAYSLYEKKIISERHRHRYEVNAQFEQELAKHGLLVSGRNPETGLIEIMEMDRSIHPFFIGTQAHPEFKSRLVDPAPMFLGLIKASCHAND